MNISRKLNITQTVAAPQKKGQQINTEGHKAADTWAETIPLNNHYKNSSMLLL